MAFWPARLLIGVTLRDWFAVAESQLVLSFLLGAEGQLVLIFLALVCRDV